MWGAVIGDIVGSRFENENLFSEYFELFDEKCIFTDDTVMTLATLIILQSYSKENITEQVIENNYRKIGCSYIQRGFGGMFYQWLVTYNQGPYGSYGNGCLMRISPLAKWAFDNNWSKDEMLKLSNKFTNISHNHESSLKAVHLYLEIIFDLFHKLKDVSSYDEREKISIQVIQSLIGEKFEEMKLSRWYKIQNTKESNLEALYTLDCVLSVLKEILLNEDNNYTYKFEYGIKKIVSIGGDCDTTASILGAILEVIYGIAPAYKYSAYKIAFNNFDQPLIDALNKFYDHDVRNDAMFVSPNLLENNDS